MVTLDQNGSGFPFMAVQCAARNTWNTLVTDYHFSVYDKGDQSADKGNIKGLPFSRIICHHFCRGQETIYPSEIDTARFLSFAVYDLDFVSSPQVYTTVTAFGIPEFDMQFEVVKQLVCHDIGS